MSSAFELATPQTRKSNMFILQPAFVDASVAQQRTANATDANHKHFDNLIGIEQHLMSNAPPVVASSLFTTTEIERSEDP